MQTLKGTGNANKNAKFPLYESTSNNGQKLGQFFCQKLPPYHHL